MCSRNSKMANVAGAVSQAEGSAADGKEVLASGRGSGRQIAEGLVDQCKNLAFVLNEMGEFEAEKWRNLT